MSKDVLIWRDLDREAQDAQEAEYRWIKVCVPDRIECGNGMGCKQMPEGVR